MFDQRSKMTNRNEGHGFKAGLDYFVDKKSTIGFMVNGNFSDNVFGNNSRTDIIYIPSGIKDRVLVADNSSKSTRNNANFNFNYRYAETGVAAN
jgi:iron complex outermembrane receptor protein